MRDYPDAYVDYIVHFHGTRDYFECHEIMEEHWKQETDAAWRRVWLCLIQTAVAAYHERRGNAAGAWKMWDSAIRNLDPVLIGQLGLDAAAMKRMLAVRRAACAESASLPPFADPDLPIIDPGLIEISKRLCFNRGIEWKSQAAPGAAVVHKHKLRDRSGVILERERQSRLKHEARAKE